MNYKFITSIDRNFYSLMVIYEFLKGLANLILSLFAWFVKLIAIIYTDIFRNTPLLVQIFFIHFGLPNISEKEIDLFLFSS